MPWPMLVGVCLVVGAVLTVGARRRLALVAGLLTALVPVPLATRPEVLPLPWVLAVVFHLVAALLAGHLLMRAVAHRALAPVWPLPGWSAALVVILAAAAGFLAWSPGLASGAIASVPGDAPAGSASWLEPARWLFAGCLATVAALVVPIAFSREPARVAAAGGLVAAAMVGLWAVVGTPPSDATLLVLAALPASLAAATYAVSPAMAA